MATAAESYKPKSFQACERCHKRKKKCDRIIPECNSCKQVNLQCIYADQSVGSYAVSYVSDLEEKVSRLQEQVRKLSSGGVNSHPVVLENISIPNQLPTDSIRARSGVSKSPSESSSVTDRSRGLADELGTLSLSASAEGHYLGPGSGISFAKFTQSIIYQLDSKNERLINDGVIIPAGAMSPVGATSPDSAGASPGRLSAGTSSSRINDHHILGIDGITKEAVSQLDDMLPNAYRAADLAEFYWRHSHTLYPFIQKELFSEKLEYMLDPKPEHKWAGIEQDPLWLFQLFMVLAIGSTSIASITVSNEDEATACWQKAMTYLPVMLSQGSRMALEGVMLLVSYSFFNRMGPDTWYLVGIASRLALGMGMHTEKCLDGLDGERREQTKRVFWCVYMMDRVVSTTLGRPMAIRDIDVDIPYFSGDEDASLSWSKRSHLNVTLHILPLRKIAGETLEKVYSANAAKDLPESKRREIVAGLHQKLLEWRRGMPFPLNESQFTLIPHFTTAWFDLNYYNMVIMLFRPSPLWPNPPPENLHLVADAAAMSLKQFSNMYRQQKLSFNWLNLLSVFGATLALLFITTTQPDDWRSNFLGVEEVVADLQLSEELFTRFAMKLAPAKACIAIVKRAIEDLRLKFNLPNDSSWQNTVPEPAVTSAYYESQQSSSVRPPAQVPTSDENRPPQAQNGGPHVHFDSVMSMFSMTNDSYYENLVSHFDDSLLSNVPMLVDDEKNNQNYSNFFFDISNTPSGAP